MVEDGCLIRVTSNDQPLGKNRDGVGVVPEWIIG